MKLNRSVYLKRLKELMIRALTIYYRLVFSLDKNYALQSLFNLFTSPKFQKVRDQEKTVLDQPVNKIQIDNFLIAYYDWPQGTGPYVLLLHGWEGNAGSLGAFVKPLIEQGYKVIAPNAPAHYSSDGKQCTIRDYQKVVSAIIEKFKVEIIISHSFGSAAALLSVQELDQKEISKIILISAPNRMKDVVSNFTDLFKLHSSHRESFFEFVERKLSLPFEKAVLSEMLSEMNIKTLIIHDQDDRLVPFENAQVIAKAHDNTKLCMTKGQGHYRILWNDEVLRISMKFLNGKLENQIYVNEKIFT